MAQAMIPSNKMLWFSSSLIQKIDGRKILIDFPGLGVREHYGFVVKHEAYAFFCSQEEADSLSKATPYSISSNPWFLSDPVLQIPTNKLTNEFLGEVRPREKVRRTIQSIGSQSFLPLLSLDQEGANSLGDLFFSLSSSEKENLFLIYYGGFGLQEPDMMINKRRFKELIIQAGFFELYHLMKEYLGDSLENGAEKDRRERLVSLFSERANLNSSTIFFKALGDSPWRVPASFFLLCFNSGLGPNGVFASSIPYPNQVRNLGSDLYRFNYQIRKERKRIIDTIRD